MFVIILRTTMYNVKYRLYRPSSAWSRIVPDVFEDLRTVKYEGVGKNVEFGYICVFLDIER